MLLGVSWRFDACQLVDSKANSQTATVTITLAGVLLRKENTTEESMVHSRTIFGAAFALLLMSALCGQSAFAQSDLTQGAVYAQTDGLLGNQVIAFYRHSDGTLTEAGRFATGGLGTQVHNISAGSVLLATVDGQQLLLVNNMGTNNLSVFAVKPTSLQLLSVTPTGVIRPASVTVFGNLLYEVGELSGTISGFRIDGAGHVTPIPGSQRLVTLGTVSEPFQILFINHGTQLAVSDENTNGVDVFDVDPVTGITTNQTFNNAFGLNPFGMIEDQFGHLLVTAGAFDIPGLSTMSSFSENPGGTLTPISEAVKDFQQFECWVVTTTGNGFTAPEFAYIDNTGNSTISSYRVGADGTLTLANPVAATAASFPLIGIVDNGITADGKFLYATTELPLGAMNVYAVQPDGGLVSIQQINGLPLGLSGNAVK
jgi:6-phosphogluconolactonase